MQIEFINFQLHGDARGDLVVMEEGKEIPFAIKRVYNICNTDAGVDRGFHSHRDTTEIAFVVTGQCTFVLDDGSEKQEVVLNDPKQGLLLRPAVWREMKDFSRDCVLMVLADALYQEGDYIRDYQQFLDSLKD